MDILKPRIAKGRRGYWEIRYAEKQADGSYRSRALSTRTADRTAAQAVFNGWLNGTKLLASSTKVGTVADLIADYLSGHPTVSSRPRFALAVVGRHFGTLTPELIDAAVIQDYRTRRMAGQYGRRPGQQATGSTIRLELGFLRAVLRWAVKQRKLPMTAVPHIEMPPAGRPRDVWLDEQEEADFLELTAATSPNPLNPSRIHLFVWIGLNTGARRASIEQLKWSQVDLQAKLIDFRTGPVTKKRKAVVPISDRLLPVLVAAQAVAGTAYVLGTTDSIRREWDRLVNGTAFAGLHPHDLRRTFATLLARAGVDLWTICGLLQDSMEVVERHYAHHAPSSRMRDAVNRSGPAPLRVVQQIGTQNVHEHTGQRGPQALEAA